MPGQGNGPWVGQGGSDPGALPRQGPGPWQANRGPGTSQEQWINGHEAHQTSSQIYFSRPVVGNKQTIMLDLSSRFCSRCGDDIRKEEQGASTKTEGDAVPGTGRTPATGENPKKRKMEESGGRGGGGGGEEGDACKGVRNAQSIRPKKGASNEAIDVTQLIEVDNPNHIPTLTPT